MNVLALDLGSTTGWAYDIRGISESGFKSFEVQKGEVRGWKFIRFSAWLYSWREWNLDIVVVEKAIPFHAGQAASEIAYGFATRVEEFCARQAIPFRSVSNSTVKKFATGSGNADKDKMLRAANQVKTISDHNEADALLLLRYAQANLKIVKAA